METSGIDLITFVDRMNEKALYVKFWDGFEEHPFPDGLTPKKEKRVAQKRAEEIATRRGKQLKQWWIDSPTTFDELS